MPIKIDQTQGGVLSEGTAGVSRDDLWLGGVVAVSYVGGSATFALVSRPPGSSVTLVANAFTPDLPGFYRVRATVGVTLEYVSVGVTLGEYGGILADACQNLPAYDEEGAETNYPVTEGGSNAWGWGYRVAKILESLNLRPLVVSEIGEIREYRNESHEVPALVLGGALYAWDGSSTAADDGAVTIQPGYGGAHPLATGRWIRQAPPEHASTHQHGGTDEIATATPAANVIPKTGAGGTLPSGFIAYGTSGTTSCVGNDARLSDARTPTSHAASHQHGGADEIATATPAANVIPKTGAGGTLAGGFVAYGTSSSTACVGNDSRLSDARTPTAHATTHVGGASDAIAVATTSVAGLLSSSDKTTISQMAVGATKCYTATFASTYTVPSVGSSANVTVGANEWRWMVAGMQVSVPNSSSSGTRANVFTVAATPTSETVSLTNSHGSEPDAGTVVAIGTPIVRVDHEICFHDDVRTKEGFAANGAISGSSLSAENGITGDTLSITTSITVGSSGPTITTGSGRPTSTPPAGSKYFRSDGLTRDSTDYVRLTNDWSRGTTEANLANSDATIAVGDGHLRIIQPSTATANRTTTLGTTGASKGHVLGVKRLDATAYTWAFVNGGAAGETIYTMAVSLRQEAWFWFDGVNWQLACFYPLATA